MHINGREYKKWAIFYVASGCQHATPCQPGSNRVKLQVARQPLFVRLPPTLGRGRAVVVDEVVDSTKMRS